MQRINIGNFVGILIVLTVGAHAAQPSRVQENAGTARVAIKGNVNPSARSVNDQGAASASLSVPRVTVWFSRTADQQSQLDDLLRQQQDSSSVNYHKWLTAGEYADRFGLSQADFSKVVAWLEAQGFTVVEQAASRSYVVFSGTAAQVRSSFGTEIHTYAVAGETHFANAAEPSVPSGLAGVVLGFRGLTDFRPKPKSIILNSNAARPHFTSNISGNHFVAPDDFATVYSLKPLYDKGIDGTGQTIAVTGQTDLVLSDIQSFRSVSGLSSGTVNSVLVPGSRDPGVLSSDIGEADLDVEWAGAVARAATIVFVTSTNVFDSLQYAVDQNLAPVISVSYGDCEQNFTTAELNALSSLMQQAIAQGITVVAASGDSGAADCDFASGTTVVASATHGLAVDVPASIPYVTGVGGTQFNDTNNASLYWSGIDNSVNGSALSYIPEIAWNETAAELALGGSIAAGGGGASTFFAKPSWQAGTGVPSDGVRDVPDISFHASFDSDGYLICSQGSCVNGYRAADSTLDVVGGTSAGVPAFAGIVALLNQMTGSRQGNVNPRLYQLAATSSDAMHDIVSGSNIVPCTSGSTGCPSSRQIGYSAGTGYDQATGLGSINAYNLAMEWNSGATSTNPAPDFALSSSVQSLSVTTGTSTSLTVSIQPLNGFSGNVSLACSVPSTLTNVACSASPSTVAGSGTVTVIVSRSTQTGSVTGSGEWPASIPKLALLPFAVALLLGANHKRLRQISPSRGGWLGITAGLLIAIALIGCGGGSGTSSTSGTTSSTTPTTSSSNPVTGTVVIQGTSGADIHIAAVTVTAN